jgi:N6-adenosine-specific RNA methylase IME4
MMYSTILMDPPWNETGGGKIKRGADKHYPLVKTPDLPRVIMQSPEWRPANDCHLYMWATNTFLADAIWLMGTLGFKYKTNVVWTKDRIGLGQYFRGQHELLLFGVRGKGYNVKTDDRAHTAPNPLSSTTLLKLAVQVPTWRCSHGTREMVGALGATKFRRSQHESSTL